MNDEPSRSLSLPELLVISVVALLLIGGATFVWKGNKTPEAARHGSIPGALTRIEAAKAQYAADNRLPTGTYVPLSALRKNGYLPALGDFPADIHFVPGKVGKNTAYHFADGSHTDHPAPPR